MYIIIWKRIFYWELNTRSTHIRHYIRDFSGYFPYVTIESDITFPAVLAVLRMASKFVNLSQDDIINFCDKKTRK